MIGSSELWVCHIFPTMFSTFRYCSFLYIYTHTHTQMDRYVERELLGIERFTTNLDWANCWDHFREELKKMMVELGSELKVFYEEQDLAIILGSWNPLGLSSTTSSFLLKPGEKNELSIHIEPSKNAIDAETSLPPGLPIVVSPVKSAEKKYRNHHDQGFKNGEKATQRLSLDSLPPPPDEDLAPITPSSPPPLPPKNVRTILVCWRTSFLSFSLSLSHTHIINIRSLFTQFNSFINTYIGKQTTTKTRSSRMCSFTSKHVIRHTI